MTKRFDLSRMLTHFTRERGGRSGFEVLVKIVTDRALLAGWSERSGRRTIYGDAQAVCLTEMPLRALVEYVERRADRTRVSPHAVFVRKTDAFRVGARPAIYALTGDCTADEAPDGRRTVRGLPELEQYRYVAFDPTRTPQLDWTHEREWRCRCPEGVENLSVLVEVGDACRILPGLQLFRPEVDGQSIFDELWFMVETAEEARQLLDIIRCQADAGYMPPRVLETVAVLVFSQLKSAFEENVYPADDLPPELYVYCEDPEPDEATLLRVRAAVEQARQASYAASAVLAVEQPQLLDRDCSAFVHVLCDGALHPVVRALVRADVAEAQGDGSYHLDVIRLSTPSDRATFQETAARAAAATLKATLGIDFYVRTHLD